MYYSFKCSNEFPKFSLICMKLWVFLAYKFLFNEKKLCIWSYIFCAKFSGLFKSYKIFASFICVNREWILACNENYLSTTLRTYNFPSLFLQKICISIIVQIGSSFQLTNVLRNYSTVKAQFFYFL